MECVGEQTFPGTSGRSQGWRRAGGDIEQREDGAYGSSLGTVVGRSEGTPTRLRRRSPFSRVQRRGQDARPRKLGGVLPLPQPLLVAGLAFSCVTPISASAVT